ncbi:MAG: hypothetical protein ACKO7R_13705, partial [Pseudanabaena sp.]
FFESPPLAGFQKTDFGVSIAVGDGNTKIGFLMRIALSKPLRVCFFNIVKTLRFLLFCVTKKACNASLFYELPFPDFG